MPEPELPDPVDPEEEDPEPLLSEDEVDPPVDEPEPDVPLLPAEPLPDVPLPPEEDPVLPEELEEDELPEDEPEPEPVAVPVPEPDVDPASEPLPEEAPSEEPEPPVPDPEPEPADDDVLPDPADEPVSLLFAAPPWPEAPDPADDAPLPDPCAALSLTWTFSLLSCDVPPMPAPLVTKLTTSAKTSTAASEAAAAMRVARRRWRFRSTPRAAARISGGAMGVPDSATSSTWARPLTGRWSILRVRPASSLAGPTCLSFSAEAERSELYTCEAAAEAKPPIRVPMIEPARPIFAERAKDVAAASPEAMTVANEKSEKRPFFSSATWLFSDDWSITYVSKPSRREAGAFAGFLPHMSMSTRAQRSRFLTNAR